MPLCFKRFKRSGSELVAHADHVDPRIDFHIHFGAADRQCRRAVYGGLGVDVDVQTDAFTSTLSVIM